MRFYRIFYVISLDFLCDFIGFSMWFHWTFYVISLNFLCDFIELSIQSPEILLKSICRGLVKHPQSLYKTLEPPLRQIRQFTRSINKKYTNIPCFLGTRNGKVQHVFQPFSRENRYSFGTSAYLLKSKKRETADYYWSFLEKHQFFFAVFLPFSFHLYYLCSKIGA